ncbi:MAG TPA: hypothetical protein DCZ94_20950 [Lentisphaeria bacterium]|nr:MAG: hypothetical protein A2X48_23155 [Lentisphaerae bacterium GWF2_49_21]HBC89415.1 hypothetical protein [Lentisphaeria bacterium]
MKYLIASVNLVVLAAPLFSMEPPRVLDVSEPPPAGIYILDLPQEDFDRAILSSSQFPGADEIVNALFEAPAEQVQAGQPVVKEELAGIMPLAQAFAMADAISLYSGQTVFANGTAGSCRYYSIDVPVGTSRLVAGLAGTSMVLENNCDIFAKLAVFPTESSYNANGLESLKGEVLTVSNPAPGTWYLMLRGTSDYRDVALTATCYRSTDIILTKVPANDQEVPFKAEFEGRVLDWESKGVTGITVRMRDPMTGTISSINASTDADGSFSCSVPIDMEGEYTFDFFFTGIPDAAGGTACHTVATLNGALDPNGPFDLYAYLDTTPVPLDAADTAGMQEFLSIRNGWESDKINPAYEEMWISRTAASISADAKLSGQFEEGLYLLLYGVEGAGAGNGMNARPVLSTTPLAVHVSPERKKAVLDNLASLGLLGESAKSAVMAGNIGIIAVAALESGTESSDRDMDIALSAADQMDVLASIADGSAGHVESRKVGNVNLKVLSIPFGPRKLNVIASGFVK